MENFLPYVAAASLEIPNPARFETEDETNKPFSIIHLRISF